MPDDQGRPTAEELEAYSTTLQQLIDEARALQTAVTEELRRLRRSNHIAATSVIEPRVIERRKLPRDPREAPR
jgi:hypothetical protein